MYLGLEPSVRETAEGASYDKERQGSLVPPTCKTGATEVLYKATTRGMLSVPTLTVDSLAGFVRLRVEQRIDASGMGKQNPSWSAKSAQVGGFTSLGCQDQEVRLASPRIAVPSAQTSPQNRNVRRSTSTRLLQALLQASNRTDATIAKHVA